MPTTIPTAAAVTSRAGARSRAATCIAYWKRPTRRCFTAHRARPHSARDLRDFALLNEGESSAQAMRRGVAFEWPYSKEHFKDRYTRQGRRQACSTIAAHLSKDGLMFIHPTQNRSLTPREAARVQSYPDWFRFRTVALAKFSRRAELGDASNAQDSSLHRSGEGEAEA